MSDPSLFKKSAITSALAARLGASGYRKKLQTQEMNEVLTVPSAHTVIMNTGLNTQGR
ncbi:hypothetical protein [Nitrospira sp. Nam74]